MSQVSGCARSVERKEKTGLKRLAILLLKTNLSLDSQLHLKRRCLGRQIFRLFVYLIDSSTGGTKRTREKLSSSSKVKGAEDAKDAPKQW